MIAIIDYGMGNLGSIRNMLLRLGEESQITRDPSILESASKLILPGVGAFDAAMRRLRDLDLEDVLNSIVQTKSTPILGICLGMQLLTRGSDEGTEPGLGWIDAWTHSFAAGGHDGTLRLPHMGWRGIKVQHPGRLVDERNAGDRFYFVHSYYVHCADRSQSVATADYGRSFDAVIEHKNVMGTQFHPEKSHRFGMNLLARFAEL